MDVETKTYVVGLLESYQKREKQIELLHYELAHPIRISEDEMIGALALAHGTGEGIRPNSHASDKTLYIALNYQNRANHINRDVSQEVVGQLIELEKTQERLNYYISLLGTRHQEIVRLSYIEGLSQDEAAERMAVSVRHIRSIKAKAINELVSMYEYVGSLMQGCS